MVIAPSGACIIPAGGGGIGAGGGGLWLPEFMGSLGIGGGHGGGGGGGGAGAGGATASGVGDVELVVVSGPSRTGDVVAEPFRILAAVGRNLFIQFIVLLTTILRKKISYPKSPW